MWVDTSPLNSWLSGKCKLKPSRNILLLLLNRFGHVRLYVRPHRQQPTRLPRPWDSPGKNTGVGCHVLLQCMKVKSESEVTQSCLTLSDPMDCSLPDSSIHGIFQARVLEWGAIAFSTEPLNWGGEWTNLTIASVGVRIGNTMTHSLAVTCHTAAEHPLQQCSPDSRCAPYRNSHTHTRAQADMD